MKQNITAISSSVIAIFAFIATSIYFMPLIFFKLAALHQQFNQYLANNLYEVTQRPAVAGSILILVSFLYGIFHTIGPGHGKVILSAYLAASESKLKSGVGLAFLSALLQATSAILLTLFFVVLLQLSPFFINLGQMLLERLSYILIISLGLIWSAKTVKTWYSQNFVKIGHKHDSHSCSHNHIPSPNQKEIEFANTWQEKITVILSIGFRPCTGAIFILFLAYSLNIYLWGIAATVAMALGVGLSLSALAWFVLHSKQKAQKLTNFIFSPTLLMNMILFVKLFLGLLLILMGAIFLYTSAGLTDGGAILFNSC